jgi:56kDa selenium binding protein (SBP56)
LLLLVASCAPSQEGARELSGDSEYLYLWTAAADSTAADFLAVYDVRPDTGRYGALVTTVPVGSGNNTPHHTEHELAADRQLFANGFGSGRSFIFDVTDPAQPRLTGQFGDQAGFSHPHSFLRLPNGNVLATFQMRHDSTGMHPGGLVEMTPAGEVVRSSPASGPGVPDGLRAYSGAIVPALDRIVTSTTDMDQNNPYRGNQVQIWRLSNLELLHTITLPPGPLGDEGDLTAEPRLLADNRTVMVSTFNCGLYLLDGIDGDRPAGRLVATLPRKPDTYCAIPVVAGSYWVTTVPSIPAVVSLDISDPAHPREASRLTLDPGDLPHWIALEPNSKRLVLTGSGELRNRVLLASFNPATGALALDERFRPPGASRPGFDLLGPWPHGSDSAGKPHGAVFSRP